MRLAVYFLAALSASAGFAPEWDTLTSYARTNRHTITVDVQRITRTVCWTNPITSNAVAVTQRYAACYRPMMSETMLYGAPQYDTNGSITGRVADGWAWTNTALVNLPVFVVGTDIFENVEVWEKLESSPAKNQKNTVPSGDRLLLDAYQSWVERYLATGVITTNALRDHIYDQYKPSIYGGMSLKRLGPSGPEYYGGWNYLQRYKAMLASVIGAYVNTSRYPSSYEAYPFATNRMWGIVDLCNAVGAPINYFEYTPERDWEGRFTSYYGAVISGSWVMTPPLVEVENTNDPFGPLILQSVTNVPFTNVVVDSCGNSREIIGTNGQIVAFTCTNVPTALGRTRADYGLKYIKPMLLALSHVEREEKYCASTRTLYYEEHVGEATEPWDGDGTILAAEESRVWNQSYSWYPSAITSGAGIIAGPDIGGGRWLRSEVVSEWPGVEKIWSVHVWQAALIPSDLRRGAAYSTELAGTVPTVWSVNHQLNTTNGTGPCGYTDYLDSTNTMIIEAPASYAATGVLGTAPLLTEPTAWYDFGGLDQGVPVLFLGADTPVEVTPVCDPLDMIHSLRGPETNLVVGDVSDAPDYPSHRLIFQWNVPGGFVYQ